MTSSRSRGRAASSNCARTAIRRASSLVSCRITMHPHQIDPPQGDRQHPAEPGQQREPLQQTRNARKEQPPEGPPPDAPKHTKITTATPADATAHPVDSSRHERTANATAATISPKKNRIAPRTCRSAPGVMSVAIPSGVPAGSRTAVAPEDARQQEPDA